MLAGGTEIPNINECQHRCELTPKCGGIEFNYVSKWCVLFKTAKRFKSETWSRKYTYPSDPPTVCYREGICLCALSACVLCAVMQGRSR